MGAIGMGGIHLVAPDAVRDVLPLAAFGDGPSPAPSAESSPGPVAVGPAVTPEEPPASPDASSAPATTSETTSEPEPTTTTPEETTGSPTRETPKRPAPPKPPAPAADQGTTGKVIDLVNSERRQAGCGPVTTDARLADAAQGHSSDMAERNYFSHTSPEGGTFVQRAKAAGYPSPGAENIARGQRSAEQVMDSWMKSPGHRANILNCGLRTIGIGLDTRGWYWTQVFGR
ncbi:hypothetical protein GCM10012275_08710 [Longimycelium tulufanense]|uniref:SCP domain-containing protein n=1 Tax=Longimycelium tulufanense TaxID=907463 RepID=A0A8J3C9M0_9PSEU|nr:hypothetical protein GCM10012275_08710 [Longimycelium tulufanense]